MTPVLVLYPKREDILTYIERWHIPCRQGLLTQLSVIKQASPHQEHMIMGFGYFIYASCPEPGQTSHAVNEEKRHGEDPDRTSTIMMNTRISQQFVQKEQRLWREAKAGTARRRQITERTPGHECSGPALKVAVTPPFSSIGHEPKEALEIPKSNL